MGISTAAAIICTYVGIAILILDRNSRLRAEQTHKLIKELESKIDRFQAVMGNLEDEADQIRSYLEEV